MAKLVPATCPKCGANVKLDPEREFVTCQFCGASSFIETQKRPVTQYVQAQALPVIHVPHAVQSGLGWTGVIIILGALLGVGGAVAGGFYAYFSLSGAIALPAHRSTAAQGATSASGTDPESALVEEDYFADATRAKARYEAVLGKPIMAKQLVLMQYYGTLEAQDPKNAEHVDSYKLWANKVEPAEPVRLGSDKQHLSQLLFSLDSVDFGLVPQLIKQSLAELKLEDSKVSHVMLERNSFSDAHEPVWRVYVTGSRDNGFVEFTSKGEKRRAIH